MSEAKMPERWDLVGEYDLHMAPVEDGDWIKVEDVKPLLAEITRLREQLHLANIDAIGAHAEANDLRDRVSTLSELLSEYMRACGSLVSPRIEKKAIAALEAKP